MSRGRRKINTDGSRDKEEANSTRKERDVRNRGDEKNRNKESRDVDADTANTKDCHGVFRTYKSDKWYGFIATEGETAYLFAHIADSPQLDTMQVAPR